MREFEVCKIDGSFHIYESGKTDLLAIRKTEKGMYSFIDKYVDRTIDQGTEYQIFLS